MSIWLILCLIPFVFVIIIFLVIVFVIVKDIVEGLFRDFLKSRGRKVKGVIIESEQYMGDGFHGADPCFRGKYKFKDHRGRQYRGKFSRYCFEPYDFADSEYSFQDAAKGYRTGAVIDIYYLSWFPFIHMESIRWRGDLIE